ncbi:MAG: alpha/beta hydrolase [Anaerolineae bacterium]|nr:alpha/beta hydrolase [Anaerolineae bacterium]
MRKRLIILAVVITMALIVTLVILRDPEQATLSPAVREQAPGDFVLLPQGYVHYELAGPETGQPVVLVHGFSAPSYTWDLTFQALAAAGYRVLRYDLFGRGYSDRPETTYDRGLFVQQLHDLLAALAIRLPVDLIGHSMGGAIAADFAAEHPEMVRKVVLISPALTPYTSPVNVFLSKILKTPVLGELFMRTVFVPSLPKAQLRDLYRPERFPDWVERYRLQMQYKGFRRALLSTARHYIHEDKRYVYQRLAGEGKPVLLIWGMEDQTNPLAHSQVLRDLLAPQFLLVEEAGHLPHVERPDVVNPRLVDFLRQG